MTRMRWTACVAPLALGSVLAAGTAQAAAATPGPRTVHVAAIAPGFQDWPMWRHDQAHGGVSGETALSASSSFALHWSADTAAVAGTPTSSYSSPAIVYNAALGRSLVYVGNQEGDMNAYDSTTGALVWSYKVVKTVGLSKEIETSPAVSNGVLYFGDGDYHEYALNATNGSLICRSQSVGGIIAGSPTVANPDGTGDVVYFGDAGPSGSASDGGHEWAMYGVGNSAGAACGTKWVFDGFGSPAGSQRGISGVYAAQAYSQLADGTKVVVFGSTDPDDAIYELNAGTGAVLWRYQAPVAIDSDVGAPATIAAPGTVGAAGSVTYVDGVVYETSKSAVTFALDLRTGAQLWSFDIRATIGHGNPTQSGASLVGNSLYLGYGGGLFSLNATTGALIWTTLVGPGVVSSPAISGPSGSQVLFVGDLSGNVDAFRLSDGVGLFSYPTGALIFASAGVSTGQFFISSSNGKLYAFGVSSASGQARYMNQVYLDLLGRPMDAAGAAYWVPQVQPGGGAQDARIVAAFTATTEYRYRMVDQIYLRYLGHPPDSAGQAYWSQQIANGLTYEQLRAFILSSAEYFAISGGSNTGFVANVYGEVLQRAPSAGEQAYWQAQLQAGAARSAVAYAILTSDEGYANYINRDVYQPFLRRSADQAAYNYWIPALRSGLRDEAFVANILGSAEYYAYASTH